MTFSGSSTQFGMKLAVEIQYTYNADGSVKRLQVTYTKIQEPAALHKLTLGLKVSMET